MTSTGVGGADRRALSGAQRETVRGLGRIIMYATLVFGAGLVGFSLTTSLWLACPLLLQSQAAASWVQLRRDQHGPADNCPKSICGAG